ncbi:DNA repair protein endonuclease SAE2/CtIP C-terminus-domain-containing protein [Xylaria sp. FL1042]|nr:DNA repair protein endonuclease SAE2/CtIP C-terminus-domain-containing protein [Xylaria sp. FL1042]
MENWFRDVGKTALLEALGDTCNQINNSFRTELEAYAQRKLLNLNTELEALRQKASQVNRLEDENIKLKNEIKALRDANRERTHTHNTTTHREVNSTLRTPLAPKSTNQLNSKRPNKDDVGILSHIEILSHSELMSELLRVDKKHAKLYDKYLDLHNALVKSNDLVRERTAMYHHWVDHAKKLGEQSQKRAQRIKKLESKLSEVSQEPLNLSFSSDGGDAEVTVESAAPTPIAMPVLTEVPQTQSKSPTPTEASEDDDTRSKSPSMAQSLAGSSRSGNNKLQKTNEIASCLPPLPQNREPAEIGQHIKSEPSSDTPVVVSERCIRKRKHVGSDTPAPRRVKIESSPELRSTDGSRRSTPHESIDFDTEYHRVETPRKHTRHQRTHTVQLDDDDVDIHEHDHRDRIIHSLNSAKHESRKDMNNISSANLAAATCPKFQDNAASPLQLLDNNQVLHPRSKLALGSGNRKLVTIPRNLASLAEDDYPTENVTFLSDEKRPEAGVLKQLLDTPSRSHEDGATPYDGPTEEGRSADFPFQLPKRRELPFGKDGRRRVTSAPKGGPSAATYELSPQSLDQDHNKATIVNRTDKRKARVPLRQMPKANIRLDDFKINPDVNEGYDYAFTDVVRKKDDRTCLQGCVKENCCGHKFRVLAHACRASTRPYEFQCLLESYLGDDCHRLSTLSEAEKEALWIEAKTKELANASGKHRHRYPRMSTPPGFWRPDFPSTQEGEEYNEEAAQLEREIIEERYREAVRPGGLWVFRDE